MTFLEAAIEILRDADGALHFTEVARQAVERNLLSHVGRDPEAAMRSCLNSAVRQSRNGDAPLIVREAPGTYGIRPGAELPERKPPPEPASDEGEAEADAPKPKRTRARSSKAAAAAAEAEAESADAEAEEPKDSKTSARKSKARSRARDSAADADEDAGKKRRRRTRSARGEAPAPASIEVIPVRTKRSNGDSKRAAKKPRSSALAAKVEARNEAEAAAAEQVRAVEFEAPTGSGLEGVTDVALVMANAMSRIVEERPELREELDAIQSNAEEEAAAASSSTPGPTPAAASASRPASASSQHEEKSGRRRRRRRRRGKRVDWSGGGESRSETSDLGDELLDGVAAVLDESGPRSLHVRQIAESLASKNVLGGEISEIERAVTAAILMDLHRRGRSSRFVARGDARYQLQGTRLPEKVAKAEQAVRDAVRALENETRAQVVQWLQSLGARALESLVRIWLSQEGFPLLSALPPARGLGKLIAMDPEPEEDDGKTLVLVVPRRTALDAKLWDGEAERNGCSQVLVFWMGEGDADLGGETRVIGAAELAGWLSQRGVGVNDFTVTVKVLDATLIESIAGLDT